MRGWCGFTAGEQFGEQLAAAGVVAELVAAAAAGMRVLVDDDHLGAGSAAARAADRPEGPAPITSTSQKS
jgi:hypothetical protein